MYTTCTMQGVSILQKRVIQIYTATHGKAVTNGTWSSSFQPKVAYLFNHELKASLGIQCLSHTDQCMCEGTTSFIHSKQEN
jgi:hypothetical protein